MDTSAYLDIHRTGPPHSRPRSTLLSESSVEMLGWPSDSAGQVASYPPTSLSIRMA